MTKIIGTACSTEIPHEKCGKPIARDVGGIPHVQCVRHGCKEWVPLPGYLAIDKVRQIIDLLVTGQLRLDDIMGLVDPFAAYRQIEGLFVVGPTELDQLFRTEANPLNLAQDWIPPVEISTKLDQWIRSGKWGTNKNWQTRAALVLVPPKIGEVPTSLIGQNHLLGVAHDGIDPGIIRQDVFWSNYFVQPEYDRAKKAASSDWQWVLIYEHPIFTTQKDWSNQQRIARQYEMPISTAALDTWGLNMVLAVHGVRLRLSTYSRTCTVFDGGPLDVGSYDRGVYVHRRWFPEDAGGYVAASVQGVPKLGV